MFVVRCATRRPVMHSSHATPVPLRHRAARAIGRFWGSQGKPVISVGIRCLHTPPCRRRQRRCRRADGKAAGRAFAEAITPRLRCRSGLQRVTRAPGPFPAPRRTIFCMSPAGSSRHRHPKAHIPPRRVTPTRCIRRRDEGTVAWSGREGKMECEYFPTSDRSKAFGTCPSPRKSNT
jgi:hypothetical protein